MSWVRSGEVRIPGRAGELVVTGPSPDRTVRVTLNRNRGRGLHGLRAHFPGVTLSIERADITRIHNWDIHGYPQFPLASGQTTPSSVRLTIMTLTFRATHNFLWLLDKRLRLWYI